MLWIIIMRILDGLRYIRVLLEWDTTTGASMKRNAGQDGVKV